MIQLTERQKTILEYTTKQGPVSNRKILKYLEGGLGKVARVSVVRDINVLLKNNLVISEGKGRSVVYRTYEEREILKYTDVQEYFQKPVDDRDVKETFDFEVFGKFENVLNKEELSYFTNAAQGYQARVKELSPGALEKEFERLIIEFSWKSSHLEGNTYSLIDTEILIKESKEAGTPPLIVQDLVDLLQYHVTTYFDNEVSGIPQAHHRSGRPLKTLTQRLKGKEGRFRGSLSGKRVDFSSRTVISPDPNLTISDVGVPVDVAKKLTIPETVSDWNIEEHDRKTSELDCVGLGKTGITLTMLCIESE